MLKVAKTDFSIQELKKILKAILCFIKPALFMVRFYPVLKESFGISKS
jgi:hypothetical protein